MPEMSEKRHDPVGGNGNCSAQKLEHLREKSEQELLAAINGMDIGPAGLGGRTSALAVHIETFPTHIAGLPVAVNICCHAYRHSTVTL